MNEQQIREELARRELARRHLVEFTEFEFSGYKTRDYHRLIAATIEAAYAGRWDRLMIFVPPQYGKSELVSRRTPAWWLGQNPNARIMITSYAASLAYSFSRDARDIVASEAFALLFGPQSLYDIEGEGGPIEVHPGDAAKSQWGLAGHRGTCRAAGIGGGITGHGADLAIIDDPVKDDVEASSEAYRQRAKDWYDGSLYTRLSPNGVVILVMTRWHEDDLAGWLLRRQADGGDLWHVLRLPALAESDEQRAEWGERNYVTPDRLLGWHSFGEGGPDG